MAFTVWLLFSHHIKIITSTQWELSDKALPLVSEERESDGFSHGQRINPIHNLKNIKSK
jgi:hypothetical protein